MKSLPGILLLLLVSGSAFARTYFIDYASGDDQNDGLSPARSWKHSPGDKKATAFPASVKLQPGDTLRFKGGVRYFGEISLNQSGAEGRPITLDGNLDGTFGTGPAILDGAQMITNWKPVASAAEVGGNPLWKKILSAEVDMDLSSNFDQGFVLHRDKNPAKQAPWQRLFLIDGEHRVLPVAQLPKPTDPFYPDLPSDFHRSAKGLGINYPHQVYYEKGSKGNSTLPLIAITYGGPAPVVEPFNGGTVVVEMKEPAKVTEIGFKLYRPATTQSPDHIAFLADDELVYRAKVDPANPEMQRFRLPQPVTAKKLSYRLEVIKPAKQKWTKFQQIAAYTAEGKNIIEHPISTFLDDPENLTGKPAGAFSDSFVGVHGGNNHVYFARIKDYQPNSGRLVLPHFSSRTYPDTRYAFYNSTRYLQLPGEWCVQPLEGGKARVCLIPPRTENGHPKNIGFPVLRSAINIATASHVNVQGFLIQRYSGGKGGIATGSRGKGRPSHIRIADNEIRFLSTSAGISLDYSDHLTVENNYIHHCPGWTVGIYVNRTNDYRLKDNLIDTNSGSGIRHYEAKSGHLIGNAVLNHFGMHSSGVNLYEGCRDLLLENNFIENVIAINRSAEDLTFRNNVVDSRGRSSVSVAMWVSGRVGGRHLKNLTFENNTLVNASKTSSWATSIFVQGGASAPENLVIRKNIVDLLRPTNPGKIEDTIFMREGIDEKVKGTNSLVIIDPTTLFIDPASRDYRRKPGSPRSEIGANLSRPRKIWTRSR